MKMGMKGASDFTPHLYSSLGQEQEKMATCRRLAAICLPKLCGPSKNESFTRVDGVQWRILPVAAVLWDAPKLPSPDSQYLLISEK